MCHVAAWLIDGVNAPAHGDHFWKWAKQMEKAIPTIKITQCHSYEINVPYKFVCTNEQCQYIYSRHSKKGIDVTRWISLPYYSNPEKDKSVDCVNRLSSSMELIMPMGL